MSDLVIHREASEDAKSISRYYRDISETLEEKCWAELDRALDRITEVPTAHHFDDSGYRRSNLKKFPYYILFEEVDDFVHIVVNRHDKRHPSYGMDRS